MNNIIKFFLRYLIFMVAIFSGSEVYGQTRIWSLKQCIDTALAKNIQLNQTELTSKLNKVNYDQAKANLYPNFSISDLQSFNFGYSTNPYTYQSTKQNESINNIALNGSVTIFNGFFLRNTVSQSKLLYDAGSFDVDKMKNDLTLNVYTDYLQVLYSYKALEIAKEQMGGTQQQVERTQKFVDAGKLSIGNLYQVQSQLASDNASVVSAENQLELAKVTLMQLMEMPVTDNFDVDTTGTNEPSIENVLSSSDIFKISEGIMPEVKSAVLKTKANELGIDLAQSMYYPKLSLGGSLKSGYSSSSSLYSTTTTYIPKDIGYLESNPAEQVMGLVPLTVTQKQNYPFSNQVKDNFSQVLSLSLTIPLFNNYQAKYGTEKAKINLESTKLTEQLTRDQLRKLVEQAYTDLKAAIKNYQAAQESFKSEARSYKDIEKKFDLGLATATDFLIEKDNYEKASLAVVQSKFTYIFKSKIVDFYLGKPLN